MTKINGITTCAGDEYTCYFRAALPEWLDTLDSLTVVTRHVDNFHRFSWPTRLHIVPTTAFGTQFNKGAALNAGLSTLDSPLSASDWILSFDCDIIPPANWRTLAEPQLEIGKLYGCRRAENGVPLGGKFYPRGYFQLWHWADPTYRRSPVFDDWHNHAGHYDTSFAEQWPADRQHDLGFLVEHQGDRSKNWFGPNADPALMEELKLRGIRRSQRESSQL